jgi:cytochrome c
MAVRGSGTWLALALLAGIGAAPAAAQDTAAGQRVFTQCRACHTVEQGGRNTVGPNLHGVIGRRAGAVDGFRYSAPMQERAAAGLTWTEENLRAYLRDPKAVVPAGSMVFVGLRNDQQLNDLIAYLRQATGAQ